MTWPPVTHQDVQDELDNAQGAFSTVDARLSAAENGPHRSGFVWSAGNYYSALLTISGTSQITVVADRLYLAPFFLHRSRSIDRVGFNVATAGTAGHVARVGIWASDANNLPDALLLDAGTGSVASTGARELTVSSILPAGLLWLGVTAQSGGLSSVTAGLPIIMGATSPSLSNPIMYLYVSSSPATSSFGALTGASFLKGTGQYPGVSVRAA